MRAHIVRPAPIFSPDGGFSPEVPTKRRTHPVAALLLTWDARCKIRTALARLTPAQMRDMGLHPRDVAAEAAKPFWRE
ncbi:DUF1127 domain-containing protein [Actibacterium sp. D379-3]